jgi:hypothetical protein
MKELLTSDIGLMSLGVIVVTIIIMGYYVSYFSKKMDEDAKAAK